MMKHGDKDVMIYLYDSIDEVVNKVGSTLFNSKQKYLNEKQNALKNFYDIHKNFTENEPEQYSGERTIKAVLNYLGSKDNKKASIKTPIENVTITRNDVKHLLKDNEKERANFINRFVKTLQVPNLIVGSIENGKEYNYYIKSFKQGNQKLSGHVQIIKKCEDGNFYVTNHHLRNNKLNTILKNGQIKYDLSDLSAVQNAPDNIIINDNSQDFNHNKVFYQSAYHGTKVRGLENTGFDLSYALSGEGAMAHGYGVYTAKNKDVSDRYREILSGFVSKWFYDGKEVSSIVKGADIGLYKRTKTIGKKALLESLNKKLKEAEEKYQKTKEEDDKIAFELLGDYGVNLNRIKIYDIKRQIKIVEGIDESKIEYKEEKGQLYEVDIPDDDVLLDEDLPFSEQPEKVQAAIKQICEDYADNNKLVDLNVIAYTNNTSEQYKNNTSYKEGRNIYDIISNAFGGDREASLLLNKYGIKGITYDGRQDGRCYVVFDDKAVQVLKKYYQAAISPKTSQKAKEVINALKKIANGSEEETVKDLRNDLEQYGGTNDVTFVFGNDKKGIKHIAQKHGTKTLLKVFDTVVDGEVLRYVPNKKTVIISKGYYEAVLSLDENGKKKTWLLSGWNTKEKSSDASREVSAQSTSTQIKPMFSRQDLGAELNNSIQYFSENFNPQSYNQKQGKLFIDNERAEEITNRFTKIKGTFIPAENLIQLFKNADESTIVHEFAHWWLDKLQKYAPENEELMEDLTEIRKFLRNNGEEFTDEQHERFARGFEAYALLL